MSVFLVHGDKGGVGKSFLAAVLVEYLVQRTGDAAVVDADARNADLHAVFSEVDMPTLRADLRGEDGWMEFASFLERVPHKNVVVSLPAGVGDEVTQNRDFFGEALKGLGRSLVVFWVLNRSPHAVALLRPFLEHYGGLARAMVVVRNCFFGAPERFARWNASKTRDAFLSARGLEMNLDDLNDGIADATFLHLPPRRFSDDAPGGPRTTGDATTRWARGIKSCATISTAVSPRRARICASSAIRKAPTSWSSGTTTDAGEGEKPFPGPRRRTCGADELLDDSARLVRSWGTQGAVFEVCRWLGYAPRRLFLSRSVCREAAS
jgi:hypothetical protein